MKERTFLITYLSSFIIGILLLLFYNSARIFETIIMIVGFLILIPSLGAGISIFLPSKRGVKGLVGFESWVVLLSSIAGAIFGLLLLCMPDFFTSYLIYTFGIILILCGVIQLSRLATALKVYAISTWYLFIPIVTIIAGIVIIILGPEKIQHLVTIITGVFLLCYSVNGFVGWFDNRRRARASIHISNHE